jgi:hypothetical protein
MEVELDRALLHQPIESLLILALCAFGLQERHRIVPDDRPSWNQWATMLPGDLADEVRLAWDESERRAAIGAPAERVHVRPMGRPDFTLLPITVGPTEALALLGRPLRIILENGRNDRAFVLAFAEEATRQALQRAEDAGWVVFETAGGIDEMNVRIDATRAPMEALRTMYLCDSDAMEPGVCSDSAAAIQKHLTRLESRFHRPPLHFGRVLTRRAAENYAPPGAVLKWASEGYGRGAWELIQETESPAHRQALANSPGNAASPRRRLLAAIALKQLPERVRAVLDMKEGRGPPEPRRTADSVWSQLDTFQQAALTDGFGRTFSARFYSTARYLSDESGEIVAFLKKILERL